MMTDWRDTSLDRWLEKGHSEALRSGVLAVAAEFLCTCSSGDEQDRIRFRTLIPEEVSAALVPPRMDPSRVAHLARKKCPSRQLCLLFGWSNAQAWSSGFALSERQRDELYFVYTRNVPGGFDDIDWDCRRVVRLDPAEFLTEGEDHGFAPGAAGR